MLMLLYLQFTTNSLHNFQTAVLPPFLFLLQIIGLTPKRKKNKEKIINNKKCVPTAQYINPSAKPTPILFFILSYLLFNRVSDKPQFISYCNLYLQKNIIQSIIVWILISKGEFSFGKRRSFCRR